MSFVLHSAACGGNYLFSCVSGLTPGITGRASGDGGTLRNSLRALRWMPLLDLVLCNRDSWEIGLRQVVTYNDLLRLPFSNFSDYRALVVSTNITSLSFPLATNGDESHLHLPFVFQPRQLILPSILDTQLCHQGF